MAKISSPYNHYQSDYYYNVKNTTTNGNGLGLSAAYTLIKPTSYFEIPIEIGYRYLSGLKNASNDAYYGFGKTETTTLNHVLHSSVNPTITLLSSYFSRASLKIHGKIGAMYAFTNTTTSESNYYSSSSSSSSSSSVSFMYGAGVDLFLNESFAISADYIGSEIHHFGRVNIFSAGLKFAV